MNGLKPFIHAKNTRKKRIKVPEIIPDTNYTHMPERNPMEIIRPGEKAPSSYKSSIFLAGPSPRSSNVESWRTEALTILADKGYDGVVYVPEPFTDEGYEAQVEWENQHLNMADCILFWVPRSKELPGLTTNIEYGEWFKSGKIVLGYPPDALNVRYLGYKAKKNNVSVSSTLEDTIESAIAMVGDGAMRKEGERFVPLFIWKTKSFKNWYAAQKDAGNRLDAAQLLWTFRVGKNKEIVFSWVLHVDVYIEKEKRHKINEFVLSRTDIACVVLSCMDEADIDKTKIVIIKEFRSPASNKDCFVREIPGGSSKDSEKEMAKVISAELVEEAGISIDPDRFKFLQSRQMCATLSAHKAHLFAVSLSKEEMKKVEKEEGSTHGVSEDTELTYVEVWSLKDILKSDLIDWSMLGMIFKGVLSSVPHKNREDWVGDFLN
jgi:hypothetical protein